MERDQPEYADRRRRCSTCRQIKPLGEFHKSAGTRGGGYKYRCRACDADYRRARQPARPPPPPAGLKRCTGCGQDKSPGGFPRDATKRDGRATRCRACDLAAARADRDAARAAVLGHYGRVCACCGTAERLTIDHVNGGGTTHLRRLGLGGGGDFHAWLVRQGFPPGYQTLCRPCNASKAEGPACRLDHSRDGVR